MHKHVKGARMTSFAFMEPEAAIATPRRARVASWSALFSYVHVGGAPAKVPHVSAPGE